MWYSSVALSHVTLLPFMDGKWGYVCEGGESEGMYGKVMVWMKGEGMDGSEKVQMEMRSNER